MSNDQDWLRPDSPLDLEAIADKLIDDGLDYVPEDEAEVAEIALDVYEVDLTPEEAEWVYIRLLERYKEFEVFLDDN